MIPAMFFLLPITASAQRAAVKANLLYGAWTATPNLAVEVGLNPRATLDVGVGYNPWNLAGSLENNDKIVHLLGSVEYRYWLCERFNGHFFGIHALGSTFNIGGHELPLLFGKGSKDFRHEGWAAGAGISYGYHFILSRRWNLEASLGFGYLSLHYDRYECAKCDGLVGTHNRNYFGPTRGGLSLIYTF